MIFSVLWRKVRESSSFHADASLTAAANLLIAGLSFCTGIITARMLGPYGRGELAAIQTTPSAIASFAMIGMAEALVYFSAREPNAAGRYLGTAVGMAFLSSLSFMLIAYLAMPLLVHAQGPNVIYYARVYLLIAPIYATAGMLFHPLRGTGEFQAWNTLRVIVPFLALWVLAVAYLTGRMTPVFIAFGNLTTYAILILPSAWVVRRRIHGPYSFDPTKAAPMLHYGFPCVITGLPQMLNLRLDQMLLAAFLPSAKLGLYVVAVAWSGAVSPLLNSIGATLLPIVASTEDRACAAVRMSEGVRMTAVLAILLSVGIASATPFAIPFLFGPNFRSSVFSAMILVLAAGVLGINFSLQEGIRGLGHPYAVLRAELLGLIITAILLFVLLRPFEIIGAAVASIAGYSTVMVSLLISTRNIANTSIRSLLVPRFSEVKRVLRRLVIVVREI